MISSGWSQYTRPFGGKVCGKVIPFPDLDVRYPVAFKGGFEVKPRCPLECREFCFQRHDKDESGDTVHPVGRLPLLEVTEQRLNDVGRHRVYIFVASEHCRLTAEVTGHHASEPGETLSASHEFPVDDGDTLLLRPSQPEPLDSTRTFVFMNILCCQNIMFRQYNL